jgi:hypothetical protein
MPYLGWWWLRCLTCWVLGRSPVEVDLCAPRPIAPATGPDVDP